LTVNVVLAVRLEVPPVPVTDFAPPVVSAMASAVAVVWQDPAPAVAEVLPTVVPVVQVVAPPVNVAAEKAVVAKVTVSPAPKPVAEICSVTVSSGKPKLFPVVVLIETFGVMEKGVLTVFVPSDTTMVSAPPGSDGTLTVTLNKPLAVVVRHAVAPDPV